MQFLPDYKSGFGGSYGVQADRMDNSALGWDHYESPERHPSQKGNSPFGGVVCVV